MQSIVQFKTQNDIYSLLNTPSKIGKLVTKDKMRLNDPLEPLLRIDDLEKIIENDRKVIAPTNNKTKENVENKIKSESEIDLLFKPQPMPRPPNPRRVKTSIQISSFVIHFKQDLKRPDFSIYSSPHTTFQNFIETAAKKINDQIAKKKLMKSESPGLNVSSLDTNSNTNNSNNNNNNTNVQNNQNTQNNQNNQIQIPGVKINLPFMNNNNSNNNNNNQNQIENLEPMIENHQAWIIQVCDEKGEPDEDLPTIQYKSKLGEMGSLHFLLSRNPAFVIEKKENIKVFYHVNGLDKTSVDYEINMNMKVGDAITFFLNERNTQLKLSGTEKELPNDLTLFTLETADEKGKNDGFAASTTSILKDLDSKTFCIIGTGKYKLIEKRKTATISTQSINTSGKREIKVGLIQATTITHKNVETEKEKKSTEEKTTEKNEKENEKQEKKIENEKIERNTISVTEVKEQKKEKRLSFFGRKEKKDDTHSSRLSPRINKKVVSQGIVSMKNVTVFFNGKQFKVDVNENGTVEQCLKNIYTFGYKNGYIEGVKKSSELSLFVSDDKGEFDENKELEKDMIVKECNTRFFAVKK